MFKNIGKTLCFVGELSFWLFIATAAIFLMLWFSEDMYYKVYGLLIVPYVEFISAFLFALPLYGFGKLIQDVEMIREARRRRAKRLKFFIMVRIFCKGKQIVLNLQTEA